MSSSRKSSRIASRGPQRMSEGPTHFDLTGEEDSPSQQQSPQHSQPRHSPPSSPQGVGHQQEEEIIEDADPVRTQKPSFIYKLYRALKSTGTPLKYIDEFVKDKGYGNEYIFLRRMEDLGIARRGMAEEALANIPSDPRVGGFNPTDGNDDDKLYNQFQPRMGVAANIRGKRTDLFRSKEQKDLYSRLLKRGVINPRSVDFDFLDAVNMNLREKFNSLQLEQFCTDTTEGYAQLTAYFYSNLSFLDANRISFSVRDQDFVVDVNMLADVIGVERGRYQPINVSIARTTLELVKDRITEGRITYSRMRANNIILHKIVINCLRPKATSKTDVSNSEAKLMYAINAGKKFSLPHTILFHMYRAMVKDKGQLPYPGLVTKIFRHLNIQPPQILCVRPCDQMVVGLKMVQKMRLKDLNKALEKFKEKTPVKTHHGPTASKRKGKEPMVASSKKRRALFIEDEDDEDDLTISAIALKKLSRSVPESMERQEKEAEEREEQEKEGEEEREEENEEEREEREEEREAEEQEAEKKEEEERRAKERTEEERFEEEEERADQEAEEPETHSSPHEAIETGGDKEQRGATFHPVTSEGVSRSPADPEDVYASQFPEEGHGASSPNLRNYADIPSSAFTPSDRAEASTQTDNTADFRRIIDVLLEMRGQIYALECEVQNLKNAGQVSSVSLSDQIQALSTQIQANAKGEEVAHLREDLKKLEGIVQSMGDFQLVRVPKQI